MVYNFSERLSLALERSEKKPVDLANATGLSQALISQYLNNKSIAKNDKISIIAEYLDVSESWLAGFTDEIGTFNIERSERRYIHNKLNDLRLEYDRPMDMFHKANKTEENIQWLLTNLMNRGNDYFFGSNKIKKFLYDLLNVDNLLKIGSDFNYHDFIKYCFVMGYDSLAILERAQNDSIALGQSEFDELVLKGSPADSYDRLLLFLLKEVNELPDKYKEHIIHLLAFEIFHVKKRERKLNQD